MRSNNLETRYYSSVSNRMRKVIEEGASRWPIFNKKGAAKEGGMHVGKNSIEKGC